MTGIDHGREHPRHRCEWRRLATGLPAGAGLLIAAADLAPRLLL